MILMEICIKGVAKNDDAKYNCEQQNSRTAEQQNSRTASNSASIFGTFYMADSIKNTFLICIYACRKGVLFRYGGIRATGRAEVTDG
ncbi:MAG TPA: hypothetical protein VJY54_06540 [Lachnospiraceae bacterium]|jgi:hypothetical protein|nr:hypothetical protein [Lachnospiraceae bacterium]